MAQTTGGSSASRISEAFSFLKEYQAGLAFDETNTDPIHNGSPNGLVNGEKGEFTIITYVENKENFDRHSSKSKDSGNQNIDLRTAPTNGSDEPNDFHFPVSSNHKVNTTKMISRDSNESGKATLKDETNNERTGAKINSNCSCGHLKQCICKVDNSDDEKVVMRKEKNSDCVTGTFGSKCSDSQSNSPCVKKEEASPGRGTYQVVSDAFHFLKDLEDGRPPEHRDSGIPQTGAEDRLFKKLSLVRKPQENPNTPKVSGTAENHDSINSSPTDPGVNNADGQTILQNKGSIRRQRNVSNDSLDNSEDSSDDDTGIYNESFRKSIWVCMPDEKAPSLFQSSSIAEEAEETETDEVFVKGIDKQLFEKTHQRSDSTTTTRSESEFKHEYRLRRKCMVHRHDSQQEYHRMSAKFYEHERLVVVVKEEQDTDFGLHIFDSHPAFITEVDSGSPAQRAGIKAGQMLLSINGVNVLESSHEEIIKLVQKDPSMVKLELASSDVQHIRDQQTPVRSGYMNKQSNSTFVKNWRRRYFVLRYDNCLYYYKGQQDQDPLGAIPLLNYLVSKHLDSSRENCFKAEKFGARTYYFTADSREDMVSWISAMNEAAHRAREKKDAWMDVTASNVGLPALEIKKPDCSGYLSKCGRTVITWKKQYCVLKDACIYFYKNINSSSAQGMAHLHGYSVDPMTSTLRKQGFVLRPPESQMRTFSFSAENETDKIRWMDALQKSIQRWIKVD